MHSLYYLILTTTCEVNVLFLLFIDGKLRLGGIKEPALGPLVNK